jgi:hypothetical protein
MALSDVVESLGVFINFKIVLIYFTFNLVSVVLTNHT